MNNAVVAQDGTPRELYEAPANRFVADFIGEANILPCEIASVSGDKAQVRLGQYRADMPSRGLAPGSALLAVRPNRVHIGEAGTENSIDGEVARFTYVGNHVELTVDTAHGRIFATSTDVDAEFKPGDAVGVRFASWGPVLLGD